MAKRKVVISVLMNGEKSRSKAMKIAVCISGVESAALQGEDKGQIVVTGEKIDAVELTTMLRKKVGYAELLSVSPVEEKKDEKTPEADHQLQSLQQPPSYEIVGLPVNNHYDQQPSCSIM